MSIKDIYWYYCISHRWILAFIDNDMDSILKGDELKIRYVKYFFKNRWFADPFILDVDEEEIKVLVEEYVDATQLGKISLLKIDRKTMELKSVKDVLSLKSHLSFPNILRKTDGVGRTHIYVYPENYQGEGLVLYEYDEKEEVLKKVKLLTGDPLTDADYVDFFGKPQIFSTRHPHENEDTLYVYEKAEGKGTFEEVHTCKFSEFTARNAGGFFMHKGKVYRPAQECNRGFYGHSISLQRVEQDGDGYKFEEVRRLYPPKEFQYFGMHTFNSYKGMTIVDFKQYRHPAVARFFTALAAIVKKIVR